MIKSSNLGENIGIVIRQTIVSFVINIFGYLIRLKNRPFLVVSIAIFVVISVIAGMFIRQNIAEKELVNYYLAQGDLKEAVLMDKKSINDKFIAPFSGILKVNNAMKIAKILHKKDRTSDAIELLESTKGELSGMRNELVIMEIFILKILANGVVNEKDIMKIAKSSSRYAIFAKELLAEHELYKGNTRKYALMIRNIKENEKILSPNMQFRIEELYYIASQNFNL